MAGRSPEFVLMSPYSPPVAHPTAPARGAQYWGRPPAWQPVYDRHDARDPLKSPAVECGAIRAARSC